MATLAFERWPWSATHARGNTRPDSDRYSTLSSCFKPIQYLHDLTWLSTFGAVQRAEVEDWGNVQSIRAFYTEGPEVEFGVTSAIGSPFRWTQEPQRC